MHISYEGVGYVPRESVTYYGITEKQFEGDPTGKGDEQDFAYYTLANMIREEFGYEPVTLPDIYYNVTSRFGLSYHDTVQLIKGCLKNGYLTRVIIR